MSNDPYTAMQHKGVLRYRSQLPTVLPPPHRQPLPGSHARPHGPPQNTTNQAAPPTAELSENHAWVRLTIDLPGVLARDLDVAIHHGILTITGSRQTMSVDGAVVLKKHKFSRRYAIDTNVVDVTKVSANLSLGVLTIKAPKKTGQLDRVKVNVTEGDKPMTFPDVSGNVIVATSADGTTNTLASIAPVGSTAVTTAASDAGPLQSLGQSTIAANDTRHDETPGGQVEVNRTPQMVKPDEESDMTAQSPDEDSQAKVSL